MNSTELSRVELYTDGACSGNPGPGGWAFILRHKASGKERVESGAEPLTTNNRMELMAVIKGLEALKRPCEVELFTDSVYVGKGDSEWMPNGKRKGWSRKEGGKVKPVKNEERWRRLDEHWQIHRVKFHHVAGHSGHPENEGCDQLAVAAYQAYRDRGASS